MRIGGMAQTHDALGNLATDSPNRQFVWNCLNQLKEIKDTSVTPAVTVAEYLYDAYGRRVRRELPVQNVAVEYVYNGADVIEEHQGLAADPSANLVLAREFVRGLGVDEPILMDADLDGDGILSDFTDSSIDPDGGAGFAKLVVREPRLVDADH